MKGLKILFIVVLGCFFVVLTIINSCRKGSGILGPGYVMPTPTATFTPDINYSVLIHQEGTPVTDLELTLKNETTILKAKTDKNGIGGFKVNEYGKWSLLVDTFNGFKSQVFVVEPSITTFTSINYGIPSLELNLLSGNEQIPISPNSITYTVKYHTKFEREKRVFINNPEEIISVISNPYTVTNDGDELTIRLDIPKSFEGYTRNKKYLDIYAYTQDIATQQIDTKSNTRALTKNWTLNITVDYYYMTLFDFYNNDGKTCYYAGIKNIVLNANNIPFSGTVKYDVVEFGNVGSGSNAIIKNGLADKCMPDFTSYGCFSALAKVKTNNDEFWAWRDGMGQNGWLKIRIYDGNYLDVVRTFSTTESWSIICFHWQCVTGDNSPLRKYYACTWGDVMVRCDWPNRFRAADITRYRMDRINIAE